MLTVQHAFSVHRHHQNHTSSYVGWLDSSICRLKSYGAAIEIKAFKNYFPVVLFFMLQGSSLNLQLKPLRVTFHKKAITEVAPPCGAVFMSFVRWFHLFEFVNETLKFDNSNATFLNTVLSIRVVAFRDLCCLCLSKFGNHFSLHFGI